MAMLMTGDKPAENLKSSTLTRSRAFLQDTGRRPCLAVVLVGADPAGREYAGRTASDCDGCEILCRTVLLSEATPTASVLHVIKSLNADPVVDGIIVQMPVPGRPDNEVDRIKYAIDPMKDVDCLNPLTMGRVWTGNGTNVRLGLLKPCTPAAVMYLLDYYKPMTLSGRTAVVVGRSRHVGRPMAELLTAADMTVTLCHTGTRDLEWHTANADLIVTAAGVPNLIKSHMVRRGAIVIDVAMNVFPDERLHGDCSIFPGESPADMAVAITPVPNGVGPVTRAMLMANVMTAALNRQLAVQAVNWTP